MSFSNEATGSSIHVIDGSDPSLLGLQSILRSAGLLTVVIGPEQALDDVLVDLEQHKPRHGFEAIHLYGHGRPGEQELGRNLLTGTTVKQHLALGSSSDPWLLEMATYFSTAVMWVWAPKGNSYCKSWPGPAEWMLPHLTTSLAKEIGNWRLAKATFSMVQLLR